MVYICIEINRVTRYSKQWDNCLLTSVLYAKIIKLLFI